MMENVHQKTIIFVLGGPGVGKGTLCSKLEKSYGLKHLSMGELLRNESKKDSDRGVLLRTLLKKGQFSPDHIVIDILNDVMREECDADGFLIDGFPRTIEQVNLFETTIKEVNLVLFLEASFETMEQRVLKRAQESTINNLRTDDNLGALKKRFELYQNVSLCVLDVFPLSKIIRIDATQDINEVYTFVATRFHSLLKMVSNY
jgi:adenylate kinase family enzyme